MKDHDQDIQLECDSDDCASGRMNRYYAGKRMRPASFEIEQTYLVERRRLLNRAIHGWGVVYGFGLRYQAAPDGAHDQEAGADRPRQATLRIGEGLALDRAGRELVQVGARRIAARDVYMPKNDLEWLRAGLDATGDEQDCWLLSVHYAERLERPVRVKDDCSCDRAEWDYLCETVHYSVRLVDASRCHASHRCELRCRCTEDDACGSDPDPTGRGSHQCMSRYVTRLNPIPEHVNMSEPCDQLSFDLANGIALARVDLRWHCGAPEFTALLDDWGPRRLVKRNDLLFDLIRGCDLTRISDISWRDWHRRTDAVEWADFAAYFDTAKEKGFTVTFSNPVQRATVLPDCFVMNVITAEPSGWGIAHRVPIVDLQLADAGPHDPPDSTRSATLIFKGEWLAGELDDQRHHSLFSNGSSRVEIEVRTGFILDVWGQAVDGSPIGAQPAPTGSGSPGGRYLSIFRVKTRPRPDNDN